MGLGLGMLGFGLGFKLEFKLGLKLGLGMLGFGLGSGFEASSPPSSSTSPRRCACSPVHTRPFAASRTARSLSRRPTSIGGRVRVRVRGRGRGDIREMKAAHLDAPPEESVGLVREPLEPG